MEVLRFAGIWVLLLILIVTSFFSARGVACDQRSIAFITGHWAAAAKQRKRLVNLSMEFPLQGGHSPSQDLLASRVSRSRSILLSMASNRRFTAWISSLTPSMRLFNLASLAWISSRSLVSVV